MDVLSYFDDLSFVSAHTAYACDAVVDHQLGGLWVINFLYSGAIEFGRDEQPLTRLEAPAIYWTWPQPHWRYWSIGDAPWIHSWVAFSGVRCDRLIAGGLIPELPCPAVRLLQKQPAADLFDRFARLVVHGNPPDHAECVLLLERLLWIAQSTRLRADRRDGLHDQLNVLAAQIRAEPFRNWYYPHLARDLGISYSHFRARFRESLESTPAAFLQRCRMLTIARELEIGQSIKSVAYGRGYYDLGNFSRLFRSVIGVSPRAYLASLPGRRPLDRSNQVSIE